MRRSSTLLRNPLLLIALSGVLATGLGCPDKDDGDGDGGVTDGGGTTDGGGSDGGGGGDEGERCATAWTITPGVQESGDSTAAADDHAGTCGGGGIADVVYTFDLAEASGVEVFVQGFDAAVYLSTGACGTAEEIACADQAVESELITVPLLDPGTYFIVIDGYDAGGPYTVDLTVTPGGICVADDIDAQGGGNVAGEAAGAGSSDIDTRDVDPDTAGDQPFPLSICEGDVDYFLIGHFGGAMNITAETSDAGTLTGEVYNATIDASDNIIEGALAGATPFDSADATRGYYLLRVSGTGFGPLGMSYSFAATHGCQGDRADDVDPTADDEVYERARYAFYDAPDAPIERSLCGTDIDTFVLTNLAAGDITVTLTGFAGLDVTVAEVVDDGSGGETVQAYAGTVDINTAGSDVTVSMPAAPMGKYVLTLSVGSADASMMYPYGFTVTFAGIASPPANDLCSAAETLVASETPTAVPGRTVGGGHEIVGPCGGEEIAVGAGKPGALDVFYALNLPSQNNLQIDFDGGRSDFFGQVYLLEAQATCPADLSTLTVVAGASGEPICRAGRSMKLRYSNLPAGDYLVVVDGIYQEEFFIFPESWTEGGFDLTATLFPAGFPVPAVCTAATAITLPAVGASTQVTVDNTGLSNELDFYPDCETSGGGGNEQVFTITPSADVTLNITSEGYDTILALREAACDADAVQVACNDDSDPPGNFGSRITTPVTAGTTYYLIVDAWAADEVGTATVTVEVQ